MPRILIVDDEESQVDYLSRELQGAGWSTGYAYNGVDAVLKVIDEEWDTMLMDIRMPELGGIGALKIVRRLKPDLPVIMFTGQAGQGDMYETSSLGAYTCLLKPVDPEQLFSILDEIMRYRVAS